MVEKNKKNDRVSQFYWTAFLYSLLQTKTDLQVKATTILQIVKEIASIEGFHVTLPTADIGLSKPHSAWDPTPKNYKKRLKKLERYLGQGLFVHNKKIVEQILTKNTVAPVVAHPYESDHAYDSFTDTDDEVLDGKFVYVGETDSCIFNLKKFGVKCFSGDEVHKWYEWYSADSNRVKGGLQRNELARKFNIPKMQMYAMLRAMGLTKTSPNAAPWVLTANKGNLEDLVNASLEQIEGEYIALHDRKKEAFFRDQYFKLLDKQKRFESLTSSMQLYSEQIPFTHAKLSDYDHLIDRNFEINLVSVLSDWHIGAKGHADRMAVGTPYGSDVRKARLGELRLRMVEYRNRFRGTVNHVYGMILGDMIDDPMSRTFPNQAMEQDIMGAAQLVEAVRSLSEHILFHYEVFDCPMTWHLVVGNHGYEFESVLYYWLTDHLKEWSHVIKLVPVTSRYANVVDPFSSTQIIGLHGDGGVSTAGISMMLSGGEKHQLILHGHKHHLQVEEIPRGFRVMCPSLMGGNAYSQGFGADSRAGQIMIELYSDGPRPAIYLPVK